MGTSGGWEYPDGEWRDPAATLQRVSRTVYVLRPAPDVPGDALLAVVHLHGLAAVLARAHLPHAGRGAAGARRDRGHRGTVAAALTACCFCPMRGAGQTALQRGTGDETG